MKTRLIHFCFMLHMSFKLGLSTRCLSCSGVIQPRNCHVVRNCPKDTFCGIRKYTTAGGDHVFDVDCAAKELCSAGTNSTQVSSNVICNECCKGDICNSKGCGSTGYPTLRGPICFSCSQRNDPTTCSQISQCRTDEMCEVDMEEKYGNKLYSSRCVPKYNCIGDRPLQTSVFGRRETKSVSCGPCCSTDLCNYFCRGHAEWTFLLMFLGLRPVLADTQFKITVVTRNKTEIQIRSHIPYISRNILLHQTVQSFSVLNTAVSNSSAIEQKAISFTSPDIVAVFCFYNGNGNEGFLIPSNGLGTYFIVFTFETRTFESEASIVGIAATDSNTSIIIRINTTVTGYVNIKGQTYRNKETVQLRLNDLESFEFSCSEDLTGTSVSSNKPVVVISGNKYFPLDGNGFGPEYTEEYMLPVSKWGRFHVIPPIPDGSAASIKIVPLVNGSKISISGRQLSTEIYYLNGFLIKSLQSNQLYIVSANNPVSVILYRNKVKIDPAMTIVPAKSHYLNQYIVTNPEIFSSQTNYLVISIYSVYTDQLLLDDKPITSMLYRPLYHNFSNWTSITVPISSGVHRVTHSLQHVKFGVLQYGFNDTDAYAYPAGLDFSS